MIDTLNRFRKEFYNWVQALYSLVFDRYPVMLKCRDGRLLEVKYRNHLLYATYGFRFSYDKDAIVFTYKGNNLKFYSANDNGSIGDVFALKELDVLDVRGKAVVDIGANIGDSSIFFSINGASKVLAIEPFPRTYKNLEANIKENRLIDGVDNIVPLNAALGIDSEKTIRLSAELTNTVGKMATDIPHGTEIRCMTLAEIFNIYDLNDAAVKIDCEGCEYEVIQSLNKDISDRIQSFLIEYHEGAEKIKSKLQEHGFLTEVFPKSSKIGLIFAFRNLNS